MSPSRGGRGLFDKSCGLAVLQLLGLVYLVPFFLTYAPARVALWDGQQQQQQQQPRAHGASIVPAAALVVSVQQQESKGSLLLLQEEHYILMPLTLSSSGSSSSFMTSMASVPDDTDTTGLPKTIYGIAAKIPTTTTPPDLVSSLTTWHAVTKSTVATSSTTSRSSTAIQLVMVNATTWCLLQNDNHNQHKACRTGSLQGDYYYDYDYQNDSSITSLPRAARVSILARPSTTSTATSTSRNPIDAAVPPGGFRKNPNKPSTSAASASMAHILHTWLSQAGFGLLAGLQLALCWHYWNARVPVSAVAKQFRCIWNDGQLWRCLSGCLAHFDAWHIGLNLSAFWQLSQLLQHYYPSPGLYLSLNLVVLAHVSAVWVLWQYGMQQRCASTTADGSNSSSSSSTLANTPTVGYSGVLFCLSTMVTLQQYQSCPIPLMESLCFSTHRIAGLPMSLAPLVQLGMVQVLLPRVSFAGHLAGIIVGYAHVWQGTLLGTASVDFWWLYPSLVWPAWHLIYLFIIVPRLVTTQDNAAPGRRLGDSSRSWYLSTLWTTATSTPGLRLAISIIAFSIHALGWTDPLVWSFASTAVFWYQSMTLVDSSSVTWKRAFCVYALILLMTQASTLSAWALLPTVWWNVRGLVAVVLQALTLWGGMIWVLDDVRHTEGIFYYTIGCTIMQPLGQLQSTCRIWRKKEPESTMVRPFPGEGRTLRDHVESEMV